MKNIILLCIVIFSCVNFVYASCGSCNVIAHEETQQKSEGKKPQVEAVTTATPFPKKNQLTITGTVICTSCDLKKLKGAKSQCSVYGCNYALKVKQVIQVVYDKDGNPVMVSGKPKFQYRKDYIGKMYHILANDSSAGLLQKEYKGKDVIIVGKIYSDENIIEVDFVKLAPAKKVYTCPMCGGEFGKPGKCPKCGMDLIEKK